jgi:DNA-binding transcriptional ArsR family regulator
VSLQEGQLHFEGTWRHCAATVAATLDGDVAFEDVQAAAEVGGNHLDNSSAIFQAIGSLELQGRYADNGGSTATWKVTGQVQFVGVDGRSFWGQRPAFVVATTAAALGAAAWAAPWAAALVLRARTKSARDHPARDRLVLALEGTPGLTIREAAQVLDLSKTATRFHVRVLSRAGLVAVERHRGREHLRSTSARLQPDAMAMHSALRNPIRRQIYDTLHGAQAPLSFPDLRRRWTSHGQPVIAQPLALYHAQQMIQAGLLQRQRVAGRVLWAVTRLERAAAPPTHAPRPDLLRQAESPVNLEGT